MSRSPALALSALLVVGAPAFADEQHHQAQADPTIELVPEAVEFSLSNGMRVVVSPDRRAPVVTHMVWYQVGAADELPGESGVAHFLEHLMFKGTSAHPGAAFDQAV